MNIEEYLKRLQRFAEQQKNNKHNNEPKDTTSGYRESSV